MFAGNSSKVMSSNEGSPADRSTDAGCATPLPGTPEALAQRVVECVDLVPNARQHDETRHLDVAASIAILSLDASPRVRAGVDLKLLMEVQGVAAKQLADRAGATGAS